MVNLLNNFFSYSHKNDLISIVAADTQLSYKELFDQSRSLADFLSKKMVKKSEYVPVLISDQVSFIKTIIALWYLGAIPVPLNTRLTRDEIISIIEDYNFNFLITEINSSLSVNENRKIDQRNFSKEQDSQAFKVIEVSDSNSFEESNNNRSIPSLNDEAVVIFTSGTTSRPKGVVHTFYSLISNIQNGKSILQNTAGDAWLASLPFYHIGGFQIICRSLYNGCKIIIPASLQIEDIVRSLTEFNPTHLSLVSAQLEKLINQNIRPGRQLKLSLIGGGFIDDNLLLEAGKLGWNPYKVYGSSETSSFVTAISSAEIEQRPGSVGKTLDNVQLKISDHSEILIKSDSLFSKYLNDIEPGQNFLDSYFRTGDSGFIDAEGYLFIEARRTDLIVTGGENVNPIEVEKVIRKINGVKDVCVFPKPNKTWGQIVACVIVSELKNPDLNTIKGILKKTLAGYKIPKEFIFTDELPKSSLGKLEREKIKKMF